MGYCGGPPDAYPDLVPGEYLCDCAATAPSTSNNANIQCCMKPSTAALPSSEYE